MAGKVDKNGRSHDTAGRFAGNGESNGNGEFMTADQAEMVEQLLLTVNQTRTSLARQMTTSDEFDPRRSIPDECGWPRTENLTVHAHYKPLYDREPVANRVVELEPRESWKRQPSIQEVRSKEEKGSDTLTEKTAFEKDWDNLGTSLRGGSKFQDEEGSPAWAWLKRADIQSRIGSFGLLLIGLNDGKKLEEEAETATEITFLRVYDESLVSIVDYERDETNPRFGDPLAYTVMMSDPTSRPGTSQSEPPQEHRVHWTRVIHLADNRTTSEVFGIPAMLPVINPLVDIRKIRGGSAEMYWLGALPGWSWESHPALGGDVEVPDAETMKRSFEDLLNGLQRVSASSGGALKSLAPQVVDPNPQIRAQIEAICIQKGCPVRIFIGSERGELSSQQDERAWNSRMEARQDDYLTPFVIVPFVDRLIMLGVLSEPEAYSVTWPPLSIATAEQQAEMAGKITEAIVKYIQGGGDQLIIETDFLVEVIGMPRDLADKIVEAATKQLEDEEDDEPDGGPEVPMIEEQFGEPIQGSPGEPDEGESNEPRA